MTESNTTSQPTSTEEIPIPPNRWLGMLSKPLEILQYIFRYQPEFGVHRNLILTGILFALGSRLPDWLAKGSHPIEVMIILLVIGPFAGLLSGYIFAAVSTTVGKWVSPVSDKKQMRTAIAWSGFPFAVAYGLFSLTYLIAYYLRPDPVQKFLIGNAPIGWLPVALGGIIFLYAIWVRWRSIGYTIQNSLGRAILCWAAAFIMTYGPLGILAYAYFGLYTKSLDWIMAG